MTFMVRFSFSQSIQTAHYGKVQAGDVVEVMPDDADRYQRAGWGQVLPPVAEESAPKPKRAARKRAGSEGES